jgi:hydrogenase maturation protein HypF
VVLRRSRGYVPRAVAIRNGFTRPVLGCGALLKNTFCLAADGDAWLGPHIGDLEEPATFASYQEAIDRMQRFLRIEPAVVACDLHPDYFSTRYARSRRGVTHVGVQHHHAHVASAMAEHGIDGPVIGIAYDGTGYGTDGTMWGGEVLVATFGAYRRAATFRPIRLIGGDRAIREPWRIAAALLWDAFGDRLSGHVRALLDFVPARSAAALAGALESGLPAIAARGVGRYFDAFGSLFLRRAHAAFEGQIALEWNQAADPGVVRAYAYRVARVKECDEIDLRPAIHEAVDDWIRGEPAGAIAAAFHNTLADATAGAVRRAARSCGRLPVVASGGCFQNARLAESVRAALVPEYEVFLHERVPPGDGGIALGQVMVANARVGSVRCP